jgi:threonine dehydrogenase-like Zn-dependent dehydrogenase
LKSVVADNFEFSFNENYPTPLPGEGEELIKVVACGMCGSDLHVFEKDPNYAWIRESFPLVMGHELIGRRAEDPSDRLVAVRPRGVAGDGKPVRIGLDRDGGFAEYAVVPKESIYDFEAGVPVESAVLCEPLTIAVSALRTSGVWGQNGSDVATQVVGMGAIGLLVGCVLAARGVERLEMVGTNRDANNGGFEVARKLGLNPVEAQDAQLNCDLIVNAAGSATAIESGMERLGESGTFLNIALGIGQTSLNIDQMTRRRVSLLNAYGSEPRDWEIAIDLLNQQSFDPSPIISHSVELENLVHGFELLRAGEARKVIIDVAMEGK